MDEKNIPVYGFIESDQKKIDNENVFPIKLLDGKNKEYFVIIPLAFHQSIKDKLKEFCYSTDDYYYNDCIIENRSNYYEDTHGNRIIGNRGNIKIVFNGYNSIGKIRGIRYDEITHHMDIGSNTVVDIEEGFLCRADFNIRNNVNLKIGKNCTFLEK